MFMCTCCEYPNSVSGCLLCLCDQQGGSGSSTSGAVDSNGGPQDLQMAENLIYYSREEGKSQSSPVFWAQGLI